MSGSQSRNRVAATPEEFYRELGLEDRLSPTKVEPCRRIPVAKKSDIPFAVRKALIMRNHGSIYESHKKSGLTLIQFRKETRDLENWDDEKFRMYLDISKSEFYKLITNFEIELSKNGIRVINCNLKDMRDFKELYLVGLMDLVEVYLKYFPSK